MKRSIRRDERGEPVAMEIRPNDPLETLEKALPLLTHLLHLEIASQHVGWSTDFRRLGTCKGKGCRHAVYERVVREVEETIKELLLSRVMEGQR